VFDVNQDEQEFYVRQEMFHRPHALQANISIIEAKGLQTETLGTSVRAASSENGIMNYIFLYIVG
jgi:hypothetical protein